MTTPALSTCFHISLFNGKNDNEPRLEAWAWETLCDKVKHPLIRQNKDGALFSPARFNPTYRKKKNVTELSLLVIECDHGMSFAAGFDLWRRLGFACVGYTSHSHRRQTKENPQAEERWRICVQLATPIPASYYPALWRWAFDLSGGVLDSATKDASRMYYLPAKASPSSEYEYRICEGRALDWRDLGLQEEVEAEENPQAKTSEAIAAASLPALSMEDEQLIDIARERYGAKFNRIYKGESGDYPKESGEPDVSRADAAFVTMLCCLTDDDEQVRRIWFASKRNRGKLISHKTYVQDTVNKTRRWLALNGAENITGLVEIEDDDPPVSDDPKREKYLRKLARNAAKLSDTSAIILRLLGFERNHSRLLNALLAIGGDRLGVFRAYQASIRERYPCTGEASSDSTVKRDLKKLREEQAALGVYVVTYKPGTKNFATGETFPCKFQNHFVRYSLQAINLWLDGLERARKENLTLSAKEKRELLEAACYEIVSTIPRFEPVKPKEKPLRYITVEEMKARFVEVEARLIETFLSEGWSESEIEQEFEWLETLRQNRLKDAVRARIAESPIRGSRCHPCSGSVTEPESYSGKELN